MAKEQLFRSYFRLLYFLYGNMQAKHPYRCFSKIIFQQIKNMGHGIENISASYVIVITVQDMG